MMYVYKTTNLINGKIYVGQKHSNSFDKNYYGSGLLIQRAIKKYGKNNFKVELLEICNSQEELDCSEKKWIKKLHSRDLNIGYNIAYGGQNGGILCDDFIEKLSGNNYYLNRYSEEERENHLNTFRRGMNYWFSKGFKTQQEIDNWICDNWTGNNHSHKKNKTKQEYENWLDEKYRGSNFWLNRCLTKEERENYINEHYIGNKNPIKRNKTPEEYDDWLNKNRRGENAPNSKYHYIITTDKGIEYETNCLRTFCNQYGYNEQVLLKLIEVSEGKRQYYIPRLKEYIGWKVIKYKKE